MEGRLSRAVEVGKLSRFVGRINLKLKGFDNVETNG